MTSTLATYTAGGIVPLVLLVEAVSMGRPRRGDNPAAPCGKRR